MFSLVLASVMVQSVPIKDIMSQSFLSISLRARDFFLELPGCELAVSWVLFLVWRLFWRLFEAG